MEEGDEDDPAEQGGKKTGLTGLDQTAGVEDRITMYCVPSNESPCHLGRTLRWLRRRSDGTVNVHVLWV